MLYLFAETEPTPYGWCWWVLGGLMAFVAGIMLLRRLVVGSTVRAIEYARFLAQTGNLPSAEYALRAALQDLDRSPRGQLPQAQEDRQLLLAALRTLQSDPAAFAAGEIRGHPGVGEADGHREADSPLGIAQGPIEQALDRARQGDLPGACHLLETALLGYPPADQCEGEIGAARFRIQTLLAHYVRKASGDRAREFQLLSECEPLEAFLPPDPPGDDTVFNTRYIFHMNRGVAAFCLRRYDQAISAILKALAAAREPPTRCKCLAYLGDYVLHQGEEAWREDARRSFDQFDREAAGQNILPALRALVLQGRAVLALHAKDVTAARAFLEQSLDADVIPPLRGALEMLRRPDPDLSKVIESILSPAQQWPAIPAPSSPLPPLSAEFALDAPAFPAPPAETPRAELDRIKDRIITLDEMGRYDEMESLARKGIALAGDEQRGELLAGLARAQMRQGRIDEALRTSLQAVHFTHRHNDVLGLIDYLDTHAEIRSRGGDYPGALRTLQEARKYLQAVGLDNPLVNARLAQTWGTSYKGCGQWEQAAKSLSEAMHFYEQQRIWNEWSLVVGDLVKVGIAQATAEGPDLDLLQQLRGLLERARPRLESNPTFRIMAIHDLLWLRERLALARRDWGELKRVREEYARLMSQEGEALAQHGRVLVENTVSASRIDRLLIENGLLDAHESRLRLDGQVSLYTRALTRAPRTIDLWQERAALHLCRARHGMEAPDAAVRGAAACLETALDIQGEDAGDYASPEVRAGWLGRFNELAEDLLEVVAFALHEVQPPQTAIAVRLLELAQTLRVRSRQDLARSLESLRPPAAEDREAVADLLARVRALHRWLERLGGERRHTAEVFSRGLMPVVGMAEPPRDEPLAVSLAQVVAECERAYPEYRYLETRGQVEAELARRKRQLEQLASRNVSVRSSAARLRAEEPFDLERWRARLAPGEAVLDYGIGPNRAQVVLLGRDRLEVFRLPFAGLRPLRLLVRDALSPVESPAGPERTAALTSLEEGLRRCGEWLLPENVIAAVAEKEIKRLYIVANGPLWGVPFAWLRAGDDFVMQRWEVVVVPSLRLAGGGVPALESLSAVAVGHPGEPPLPSVAQEVRNVAELLGGRPYLEAEATPGRVLSAVCPEADVIHFACHAQADPVVPWLSFLRLGPDEGHPDGRLMLFEVLGVPLRALVINTAACYTARAEGPMSFPESLAHAFLGAGARFVVASLWAADDLECLAFAGDFYSELRAHRDVPRAFRSAQARQRERLGGEGMTPEALYRCANFVLLGASAQGGM